MKEVIIMLAVIIQNGFIIAMITSYMKVPSGWRWWIVGMILSTILTIADMKV